MAGDAHQDGRPSVATCPMCGRAVDSRYRPFCSSRCRDQDLLIWLDGRYALPAVEADEEEDAEADQGG